MIEAWWDSLATALKFYYAIAISTSALLLLQLLLMLVGFDGDHDVDTGGDLDGDAGIHIFSVRTVTAFFTGFGWGGVVALKAGYSLAGSIAISILVGGVLMSTVLFLMRALYGLRYSGTVDYKNAIGNVGDVYLPVPGGMAGPGQVEVMVQGRLAVVRAFTRSAATIPNRTPVKVVDVLDQQTVVVEPLSERPADAEKE